LIKEKTLPPLLEQESEKFRLCFTAAIHAASVTLRINGLWGAGEGRVCRYDSHPGACGKPVDKKSEKFRLSQEEFEKGGLPT